MKLYLLIVKQCKAWQHAHNDHFNTLMFMFDDVSLKNSYPNQYQPANMYELQFNKVKLTLMGYVFKVFKFVCLFSLFLKFHNGTTVLEHSC